MNSSLASAVLKAGVVRVWVAGKTVWSPCYTQAISALSLLHVHDKALYKFTLLYFTLLTRRYYLRQGGYVYPAFASMLVSWVCLFVCMFVPYSVQFNGNLYHTLYTDRHCAHEELISFFWKSRPKVNQYINQSLNIQNCQIFEVFTFSMSWDLLHVQFIGDNVTCSGK